MSAMVERVARALAKSRGMDPDASSVMKFAGGTRSARAWESLIPAARAAITAMRDPTVEMVMAAEASFNDPPYWFKRAFRENAWPAAIDKALK